MGTAPESPMKSPDRDAAEFGAALAWKQRFEAAQATASEYLEAIDQQAAELATLRRRVAEMETDNDNLRQALCDASDTANGGEGKRGYELDPLGACAEVMQICEAALSPPTRKE